MNRNFMLFAGLLILLYLGITDSFAQLPGQFKLEAASVPQFVDPLPHFAGLRVNAKAGGNLYVKALPCQQVPLSTGTVLSNGTIGTTPGAGLAHFWGYSISTDNVTYTPAMWPGFTVEAKRGYPLNLTYMNKLNGQTYANVGLTVDQSINWASPVVTGNPLVDTYTGSVPICIHLHGGEVPSSSDGGPDSWFTPDYAITGDAWSHGVTENYTYPNAQEAATLWFHDHVMGATRLNVYAGMEAFYLLRGDDEEMDHLPGWSGDDLVKENAPSGTSGTFNPNPYLPEIEIAVQDRNFDTYGKLFFDVVPPNPDLHPYWEPEFFGDFITVNGRTWPYLSVAPRKYRFRFLDGSNARFYNLWLEHDGSGNPGPAIIQVGTDGGLLNSPVTITYPDKLFIAPGERADLVIDFSGLTPGDILTLRNDAAAPYPMGDLPNPQTTGRIMHFVVNGEMRSAANPADPGIDKSNVPSSLRITPLVALTNFNGGVNFTPAIKRQIILNEIEGEGGPEMVLLNNSMFDLNGMGTPGKGETELPVEGTTELWQIINLTQDAHPMHLHLTQFQLVGRQDYDDSSYEIAYENGFGGNWMPGMGPAFPYDSLNADGAVGGNPAVSSYLLGSVEPARENEKGWKDVVKVFPHQVATFAIRFAPTDIPLNAPGDQLLYPFDPSLGPGYVWHCHIVDHEDNEMMRPYVVIPSPYRATAITDHSRDDSRVILEQNSPNPVNNITDIRFQLPSENHVRMTLFNSMGSEIKTLINADAAAGSHTLRLYTDNLSSGVYFYQLTAGDVVKMKKMIIVR